jgi:inner membrane protein
VASVITHGVIGLLLGKVYTEDPMPARFWVLAAACAIAPDADALGWALGVPYESFLGHRGFTHSLVFAALLGLGVVLAAFRAERVGSRRFLGLWAFFFVATASHGVLDGMTDGGLGIAFFSPFDTGRYFLPLRPITVSPLHVGSFFGRTGLRILANELRFACLPVFWLVILVWLTRRWIAVRARSR